MGEERERGWQSRQWAMSGDGCITRVSVPSLRPAHCSHWHTTQASAGSHRNSECLTIFLGVAWDRGDMISLHSDLKIDSNPWRPQLVVPDAQGNLILIQFMLLTPLTPRLAQLASASQLRCQLVTRLTVCSSNSTFYWFLFCCGHGSLHDTSHSSHVGLIRTGITRHTEDVPLLAHRVRALAGARAGEWERPEAPRAAGPGRPAPHTPREIRGKKGTGTSLIMWTDNTNNFYPSTIQIISSGPGHVRGNNWLWFRFAGSATSDSTSQPSFLIWEIEFTYSKPSPGTIGSKCNYAMN